MGYLLIEKQVKNILRFGVFLLIGKGSQSEFQIPFVVKIFTAWRR